jgi:histidinol-phosphate phosphatase family protein
MTIEAGRPAAFLDRDGTIIHDASYIGRPEQVQLLPGAADAIRRLNDARVPVVIVTNQSGIARGLLTTDAYDRVHARLVELLARENARIDASYMCPHHPEFTGECDCRKPGTLLYRLAAAEHGLDLARSLFVGDRFRDVEPARAVGGTAVLVAGPSTPGEDLERAEREGMEVVNSLAEAVTSRLKAVGFGL